MNNLDLTKILKGKEGIKLYSPLCGECTFIKIDEDNSDYPIKIKYPPYDNILRFTISGYYLNEKNAECLLFPSKEKRNWDNFGKQRVKRGEFYFSLMLTATGAFALEIQDTDKATDRQSYSSGNYFTTKEEAEKYANMINNILKNKEL